ncbi:hypothetical protein EDB89DRAFT_1275823 [Lactarius sanguifluus]|nr:hypothetical protein EDB89DRAFT_1275823 [Lactarius sanguifluus]
MSTCLICQENSREYQQQAIDAEIRSLTEEYLRALTTLKLRRNALAPISSLPPEVLAAIFSFLRLPAGDIPPLYGIVYRRIPWLRIGHVCHEWREVALNHPFFWSRVDLTVLTPTGATEILARAKSVPLYLELYIPNGPRGSTFENELQVHVSHICHLAISAEPTRLQGVLKGLVSPAPTLEYLSLSDDKCGREGQLFVPVTLFHGSTPRLSRFELKYCDISWKSPLFRGLKHLKIDTLSADARPRLSFWLDALDEIPQLKTLVLHSASPITSAFPFDVERTITLPSLTYFDISASPEDCGLALAHLVLPALTSLCVTAFSVLEDGGDVQRMLPYVVRHVHGPQDTRPLQRAFIQSGPSSEGASILAWPVPDIDVEVQDLPTWSRTTPSPRMKLSIRSKEWSSSNIRIEVLHATMAALPLNSLVMIAQRICLRYDYYAQTRHLPAQFWLPHILKWPFLQRVRLGGISTVQGFITMLLEYNGERGSPLLPSLTELVLEDIELEKRWTLRLCDALMRRVEQSVPLEILDLRACLEDSPTAVPLLSEIVVNVMGPLKGWDDTRYTWDVLGPGPVEETTRARVYEHIRNMWDPIIRGLEDDNFGAEDDSVYRW